MSDKKDGRAQPLVSLEVTDRIYPDHDNPSTADNLWHYGANETTPCFTINTVHAVKVDPGQLLDDPDALESQAKVESIRQTIQRDEPLPPVYLLHTVGNEYEYYLFEGMHRFTASHREDVQLLAWVAHLGCSGGPRPTSRDGGEANSV